MTDPLDPDPAATLLMIRHGESAANSEQRFTRHDDEPLTVVGIDQARATGSRLRGATPVALYASPYLRALDTAREIGRFLGLEPELVPQLREQSFGVMAGRPYTEVYPLIAHLTGPERWGAKTEGGESLREVAARVSPVIDEIAGRHAGETVVVVSHGGVMAALRAWAAGDWQGSPQSSENAGGYRLVGSPRLGYRGPLPLF